LSSVLKRDSKLTNSSRVSARVGPETLYMLNSYVNLMVKLPLSKRRQKKTTGIHSVHGDLLISGHPSFIKPVPDVLAILNRHSYSSNKELPLLSRNPNVHYRINNANGYYPGSDESSSLLHA
jgi:hypothetical protein